jgi:hypothetical protein
MASAAPPSAVPVASLEEAVGLPSNSLVFTDQTGEARSSAPGVFYSHRYTLRGKDAVAVAITVAQAGTFWTDEWQARHAGFSAKIREWRSKLDGADAEARFKALLRDALRPYTYGEDGHGFIGPMAFGPNAETSGALFIFPLMQKEVSVLVQLPANLGEHFTEDEQKLVHAGHWNRAETLASIANQAATILFRRRMAANAIPIETLLEIQPQSPPEVPAKRQKATHPHANSPLPEAADTGSSQVVGPPGRNPFLLSLVTVALALIVWLLMRGKVR